MAMSPPLPVLYQLKQLFNRLSRASVERGMGMCQPDRSRRQIAAGRPRIDTVDGRSKCRDDRNCRDNCEDFQSDMGTSSVAPVEIVVHGERLPRPESTQAREAGSTRVSPPTSDLIPPSSRGHKDRSGGLYVTELHVTELSERRASATNIDATRHLVTGLDRFDRGFGLAASFKNCIACKRDVRCVGLRHAVNNGARLRQ
jgi:hypothetical protein